MTAHSLFIQGTGNAKAPPPPPIPALPAEPGAATGAGPAVIAGQEAAQAGREAAQIQREIAQGIRDGLSGTTTTSGVPVDPEAILRQVTPIVGMSLAMMVVLFIGWPLARAFGRRLDRRAEVGAVRAADLQPQIRQLQESLDAMAVELERISEAQRFQAKLMAERPSALPAGEQRRA